MAEWCHLGIWSAWMSGTSAVKEVVGSSGLEVAGNASGWIGRDKSVGEGSMCVRGSNIAGEGGLGPKGGET